MKYTPLTNLSGYVVSDLHVLQAHSFTIFYGDLNHKKSKIVGLSQAALIDSNGKMSDGCPSPKHRSQIARAFGEIVLRCHWLVSLWGRIIIHK